MEDDYPDGIVQAEEEEEERLEPEAFTGGAEAVFRSRERVPRISAFRGSVDRALHPGKKRKIDGTTLQGDKSLERCMTMLLVNFSHGVKCSLTESVIYQDFHSTKRAL